MSYSHCVDLLKRVVGKASLNCERIVCSMATFMKFDDIEPRQTIRCSLFFLLKPGSCHLVSGIVSKGRQLLFEQKAEVREREGLFAAST